MTKELYRHGLTRIPGGSQLLSKRPEIFLPDGWPAYYRRARGVEIETLDGRVYTDVTIHGVGACPLGYADPDVERAVIDAVRSGTMSTLNCPEEVELADLLCEIHPWADMVRYTRSGGEAMAVAVRIARASTGRDRVAISGYHGWHDWYLSANLSGADALDGQLLPAVPAAGLPSGLKHSAIPFGFGDLAALEEIASVHGAELAAIIIEPARYDMPPPGYLTAVREVADRVGAVLVFDEITTGFRMAAGGVHLILNSTPDIAVFAKGMSNGYPMAAIIGRRGVMEAAERTFISSTYWTERIGPVAALATIRKIAELGVPDHLAEMGARMRAGWEQVAVRHGMPVNTRGVPPLPGFTFQDSERRAIATLYTQYMLDDGFLASGVFYPSWAHQLEHVDRALEATDRAFARIRDARDRGRVLEELRGPVAHDGLRRSIS